MTVKLNADFNQILHFLDGLSEHNSRDWFDPNKPAYEEARDTFERFIDDLIDELRGFDNLQGLTANDCIFRIYRDVRFSKDKTPYKTNFSAVIAPGGKKSPQQGYYVSIEPHERSMIAGGLHMPTSEQINRFRQAIARDASAFKAITGDKDFIQQFGKIEGERLKTAPKGIDRNHPEIDLLQLKDVTAIHTFPDHELLAGDFLKRVVAVCRAMRPFLDYLDEILL
jgi:uncharacterized protein (TIGR02453 family)